ncbi:hypothetical protein CNMCM5623_001365 [Aspergillus felis]|uniref:Uncharacterized protein n=1 Tax=Aspergillus felis TaxID=1287682 RepID=A0A8H6UK14_9EURO|nr:hypothetical protein CNMCM5623_001365 [Aspergillus felis]
MVRHPYLFRRVKLILARLRIRMARRGLFPPVSQSPPGQSKLIHSSFDPVDIRVNSGRATSEAFCLITTTITLHGVEYELASYIRLATRLEKCAGSDKGPDASAVARHGQWRMTSRDAVYVRDRLVSTFPGSRRWWASASDLS